MRPDRLIPFVLFGALIACTAPGLDEPRPAPSGYAALARCDLEDAETLFLRAERNEPGDAQSAFARGVAQLGLGKTDFARGAMGQAAKIGGAQVVDARFAPCSLSAPGSAPAGITPAAPVVGGETTIEDAVISYLGEVPPPGTFSD